MTLQSARLALILVAATALPAFAAHKTVSHESAKNKNVAIINGKPIPAATLDAIVKMQTMHGQHDTPQMREALTRQLVNIELLSQEAVKRHLDKDPEVKQQLALARKEIMGRALVAEFAKKNQVTDADIQAEYDKYKANQSQQKEYLAHQIVVDTEADAKDIIAKLKAGSKFEDLSKRSKDSADAANGGKLDWAPAAAYPKPFADALTKLQKGQITDTPVKTQYGYHVIRLDDVREAKVATLDQLKPRIIQYLTKKKLQEFQDGLAKKAKIVYVK